MICDDFLGLRHVRVNLEIDDRAMQLASELAHFLIQATVTGLIELMDQLHSVAEPAFSRLSTSSTACFFRVDSKIALGRLVMLHSSPVAQWLGTSTDAFENLLDFFF